MTNHLSNNSRLRDIISENNISLDFLKSPLQNELYHNTEFNYKNLFYRFHSLDTYAFHNFFHLLQKKEDELLFEFGEKAIIILKVFLEKHNCYIGMFSDFHNAHLYGLTSEKTRIKDLTNDEKTLSLVLIKCLVNEYANDMELGREIRRVFNQIKS